MPALAAAFYEKLKHAIKVARISRVARLTRMDYLGLPVFQCTRPFSRNMVTAQGKGFSEEKARISAIMESLEAFHGESICVAKEALFSEMEAELGYDLRSLIPNIPSHTKIKWVKGFDLIQQKNTYLPLALISLDFSDAYQADLPIIPTSNGYGGGSTQELALTHAILE
jgi:ribosomal protein S12 methylthiotransferase accessory factor